MLHISFTTTVDMASHTVVALLLCLGLVSGLSAPGRISSGSDTTIEEYAMVVQVNAFDGYTWTQTCAGTILTSRYVLSAASCFGGLYYADIYRQIRAGSGQRNTGGEIYYVERVTPHYDYVSEGLNHNIALVLLLEPLSYTEAIQPGAIISQGYTLPEHLPVSLVGWGEVEQGLRASELQTVSVVTVNSDRCAALYEDVLEDNDAITRKVLCVGSADDQYKGACEGDFGGPVILHQETYPYTLVVGVTSWRYGCENSTLPTLTTSVSEYTDWIIRNAN